MTAKDEIACLSIGKNWFDSVQGGGSDRVMEGLHGVFPDVGVKAEGLVIGESKSSNGIVGVGNENASLLKRGLAMRNSCADLVKKADVVAVHFALYAWFCRSHFARKPAVIHFHGPWALESKTEGASRLGYALKKNIEKQVYSHGNLFVTLSNSFSDLLCHTYGIDRRRVRVVPGGISIDRFCSASPQSIARKKLNWSPDEIVVVAVRRLAKRMGLENLVMAVGELSSRYPRLRLRIGGTGPEREHLERLIERERLAHCITLEGFVPDEVLPDFFAAADMSIVPSTGLEGFGLIVVESLAAGTPVLVTPVGGMPEIVETLSRDLIFRGSSREALVSRLDQVLSGAIVLPEPEVCREHARINYSLDVVGSKIRDVYEEAING